MLVISIFAFSHKVFKGFFPKLIKVGTIREGVKTQDCVLKRKDRKPGIWKTVFHFPIPFAACIGLSLGNALLGHRLVILVPRKQREFCYLQGSNSLPSNKILDQSNLNDFADDKINVTYKTNLVMGRDENSVGKGEMLVTSIFSFSHAGFEKASLSGSLNVEIVW